MPVMDPDRREDSGEIYAPDDQGEYTSLDETPRFSLQGLFDALADRGRDGEDLSGRIHPDIGSDDG